MEYLALGMKHNVILESCSCTGFMYNTLIPILRALAFFFAKLYFGPKLNNTLVFLGLTNSPIAKKPCQESKSMHKLTSKPTGISSDGQKTILEGEDECTTQ